MSFRVYIVRSLVLAAFLGGAPAAFSQTTQPPASFTFGLIDANGNASILPPGSPIAFGSILLGTTASVTVSITNGEGDAFGIVTGVSVTGAGFQLSGAPPAGTSIGGGATVTFSVKFTPTELAAVKGTLEIQQFGGFSASFPLTGSGMGPVYAYQVQQGSTTAALVPSGTLAFPNTEDGASSTATIQVTNNGNAPGQIASIAVLGSGFQLANLPFLPATLGVQSTLSFQVIFAPTQAGAATGQLQIGADTFNLTGNALGAAFAFSFTTAGNTVTLPSTGGTVVFSPTPIGTSSSSTFSISNQGTTPGVINSIGISGAAGTFIIPNPPALPLTLAAGASVTFAINFDPSASGVATANLIIDTFSFTLSGSGTTSAFSLGFSYATSAGSVVVQNGGTVVFSPASVGTNTATTFTVTNQGTSAATVNAIGLSTTTAGFTLSGLPSLPATLAPAASFSFTINFAPTTVGAATATLLIDTQSFALSGSGISPAPLPSYSFTGASGAQNPLAQPAIGLTLASSYPLDLTGTLTLTFTSAVFTDDPSIQFATGSRTVSFTIPANTTGAVFSNGATTVMLSTGSVAGTISLTPSFATTTGVNLTPASPLSLSMTIAESAPVIVSMEIDSPTATGFTLTFTGLATGRDMTGIDVHFTMAAGVNVSVPDATINVQAQFTTWYGGSGSAAFGSLFTASVPFTLSGQLSGISSLINAIQSVTLTLTNQQGTSSPQTIAVQ